MDMDIDMDIDTNTYHALYFINSSLSKEKKDKLLSLLFKRRAANRIKSCFKLIQSECVNVHNYDFNHDNYTYDSRFEGIESYCEAQIKDLIRYIDNLELYIKTYFFYDYDREVDFDDLDFDMIKDSVIPDVL